MSACWAPRMARYLASRQNVLIVKVRDTGVVLQAVITEQGIGQSGRIYLSEGEGRAMDLAEFLKTVEGTMRARFAESAVISHPGDKGENREEILSEFLSKHLPKRYGVTKGQILTRTGTLSHSADIVIYDAINCPVLYHGRTAILPIEGVYGIIEVKSRLSKAELVDAMKKIESFKNLAPRDLSVVRTREYMTVDRPSRPFGAVFGFALDGNSLASLAKNYADDHGRIHDVNFFTNLVCVLGTGLIHYVKADLEAAQRTLLLDTDEFVDLVLLAEKRRRNGEEEPDVFMSIKSDIAGELSFGRFFVYLLIMLSRLKVGVPDLGLYLDSEANPMIVRES